MSCGIRWIVSAADWGRRTDPSERKATVGLQDLSQASSERFLNVRTN